MATNLYDHMVTNDPTYTVYERKPKKKQKHNKTINIIFTYGKGGMREMWNCWGDNERILECMLVCNTACFTHSIF
jgi:hypothetical protein